VWLTAEWIVHSCGIVTIRRSLPAPSSVPPVPHPLAARPPRRPNVRRAGRALARGAVAALLVVGAGSASAQQTLPSAPAALPSPEIAGLPLAGGTRAAHVGDTISVAGRATVGSGVLQAHGVYIALQGRDGAVWVFRRNSTVDVRRGDSVQARGVLFVYRGALEIIASSLTVVPTSQLVTPLPAEGWPPAVREAQLVRVSNAVVGARGESEGGRWMRLHRDGLPDSVTLWIPWTHGDPPGLGDVRTGDRLDVTGIATLYRDNPGDAGVWQIVPRRASDVRTVGIPRLVYRRLEQGSIALGAVLVLVVIATRLLTRRQSRALRETEARYRQLLALSPDAVLVHDGDCVLFANAAAARLLGAADEHALAGWAVDAFVDADERAALDAAVGRRQTANGAPAGRRLRTWFRTADGGHVDVEVATSPCRYHDREAAVVVARDIGPQLRYERELRELALLDELTGLHNRRGFFLFAEAELRRLRERGSYAVLVFADLDGLKQINDRHGHAAGDQALRAVARGLRDVVGEQGLAARWSGDEFVALVADAAVVAPNGPNGTQAPNAASEPAALGDALVADVIDQRLAAAVQRYAPAAAFAVSASVGARRLGPDASETLAAALAAADAGLYRRRGRARTAASN